MTAEKANASTNSTNITIENIRLGIWNLKIGNVTGNSLVQVRKDIESAVPLFYRLCSDIFALEPRLFTFYVFCQICEGVEDAMLMHFSSALLRRIEEGVLTGKPDGTAIITATTASLVSSFLITYLKWHGEEILRRLETRITGYFQMHLMKAKIRVDLPTSQEAASKQEVRAGEAWESLSNIVRFLTQLLTVASQMALILNLSRMAGGPFFAFLCVLKPIVDTLFSRDLWDKVCFAYVDNEDHKRMSALKVLVEDDYRQDLISNNLGEWIIKEYVAASKRLGDVSNDHVYSLYYRRDSPVFNIASKLLGELPVVYCALAALLNPSRFSVASIAILQQSSMTLRWSLETVFRGNEEFRKSVSAIKKVYEASSITNSMNEGSLPYPPIEEKGDSNAGKGMSFDLRNVSFSYPGSQKTTNALNNASLSIKSGQLVVIVGANGSGKSTLIRILSRLYDPTSGQVCIDGHASSEYRVDDLHRATVVLSQDAKIYPLSLGENIGLGYTDFSSNKEMIIEAAKEGGALEFIQKLNKGIDTVLDPLTVTFQSNLYGNKTHPLYEEMEKLEKKIDVSGGERQRVAAARSFMRFKSGRVKFVAVDEPSSALDAEGELELFKRLIDVREGKTMVFVTHRFGHLTKHADQIICMRDGTVAETGTHEQLMKLNGEYAKLYNIQASAFVGPVQ